MAQYHVTIDSELLQHLFLSDARDSSLSKLLESILNQILEAQATEQLRAAPYERTQERQGYRNGTYPHTLTTRVGSITLRVPRLRNGKFSTELFSRYQRSEQAFILALMEMVVNGVSTRKVAEITEELCGARISKSLVSELCRRLDPLINAWKNRSLKDNQYPFLIVDALIIRIREDHRVVHRSMLIAIGVNQDGIREVLGFMIGDSESEESWNEFFCWLKDRGLNGVDLVVSDDHRGLVKAVRRNFQGASWQRCQTHFMRNVLDATPKAVQSEVKANVQAILNAPDMDTARMLLTKTLEAFVKKAPRAMEILEKGFDDATAILELPEKYRRRLRTTNSLERLNEEIRRRERVIRIFPSRDSANRLIGALLLEIDNKWAGDRRYLDMAEYHEYRSYRPKPGSNIFYL